MTDTTNSPQDLPEPPTPPRRSRSRVPDQEAESAAEPVRSFDPDLELPGVVFMVPNRHWGFESPTSDDHPGACAYYQSAERQAVLVKGTDAENVRSPRGYFFVAATPENGLLKETAFELWPRFFRLHRLRLFYPERHLGRLDDITLKHLQAELARRLPEE